MIVRRAPQSLPSQVIERAASNIRVVDLHADPARVVAMWPRDLGLGVVWSGGMGHSARSRWTVLARPRGWRTASAEELGTLEGAANPLAKSVSAFDEPDRPPFVGGRLVMLSYELGAAIEPAARVRRASEQRRWPDAVVMECPGALVHDHATQRWLAVGDLDLDEIPGLRELLAHGSGGVHGGEEHEFEVDWAELGPQAQDRDAFVGRVARTIEYIRAGDIFQANLSHALNAGFRGSARGLFLELMAAARPWYGAYLEWPGHAVVSASPELFLDFDAHSRRVETRPIKGTRPGDVNERVLMESGKDAAELNMIVDLMRNDLGRVCEFGSVRVTQPRMIERHAHDGIGGGRGVLHGVATIEGLVRQGQGLGDVLRAAFPGGSITGAPKIRAMQIIEELEQRERGPYTGAIGFVSDCGRASFNIAIRTAAIDGNDAGAGRGCFERAKLEYGVGAGIVVESSPEKEWDETLAKAEVMLRLARHAKAVTT